MNKTKMEQIQSDLNVLAKREWARQLLNEGLIPVTAQVPNFLPKEMHSVNIEGNICY